MVQLIGNKGPILMTDFISITCTGNLTLFYGLVYAKTCLMLTTKAQIKPHILAFSLFIAKKFYYMQP